MRNASKILGFSLAALALSACGGGDQAQNEDRNMGVDDPLPTGQIPPNAEIETLPADESSATSSGELQNGITMPDSNEAAENAE